MGSKTAGLGFLVVSASELAFFSMKILKKPSIFLIFTEDSIQTPGGGGHRGGGVTPVPSPLNDSSVGVPFTCHTFTPKSVLLRGF